MQSNGFNTVISEALKVDSKGTCLSLLEANEKSSIQARTHETYTTYWPLLVTDEKNEKQAKGAEWSKSTLFAILIRWFYDSRINLFMILRRNDKLVEAETQPKDVTWPVNMSTVIGKNMLIFFFFLKGVQCLRKQTLTPNSCPTYKNGKKYNQAYQLHLRTHGMM